MTFDVADPGSVAIDYLLRCGIEAAILVPLILIVQRLSGHRLSPPVKHALWFILLIRLRIPAFPESGLSLFNLADRIHQEEVSKHKTATTHTPERVPSPQALQAPFPLSPAVAGAFPPLKQKGLPLSDQKQRKKQRDPTQTLNQFTGGNGPSEFG